MRDFGHWLPVDTDRREAEQTKAEHLEATGELLSDICEQVSLEQLQEFDEYEQKKLIEKYLLRHPLSMC